jgi:hypothetical protein
MSFSLQAGGLPMDKYLAPGDGNAPVHADSKSGISDLDDKAPAGCSMTSKLQFRARWAHFLQADVTNRPQNIPNETLCRSDRERG